MDELTRAKRVLEAVLMAAGEPLPLDAVCKVFDPPIPTETVRLLLNDLAAEWKARGSCELVQVASGYRFVTQAAMKPYLERLQPEAKAPKYSRAVMETLAIIAYRQPTTRGEVEAIRGVSVSTNILKALEDRGWIEVIGHKDTPGRPALFATTRAFLNDLNLRSLSELPPLADLDTHAGLELPPVPTEPVYPEQVRIESVLATDTETRAASTPSILDSGTRPDADSGLASSSSTLH
ncbi:MAG: SMC-Scp complex subunit ScpB [Casimicrobiaceae bacterium]